VTRRLLLALVVAAALALPGTAVASGGSYTFPGGTPAEQATVRAALTASSFPWTVIPATIEVVIEPGATDEATPGEVDLDPALLDTGAFSWATVQHEFGHQVDFFLLNDATRAQLQQALGANQWSYTTITLPHSAYGCERFASEIAWAYWQSPENALAPRASSDEAGAIPPAAFRALLTQLLGISPTAARATTPKVYAGTAKRVARRQRGFTPHLLG
jgi:hypothetical protein